MSETKTPSDAQVLAAKEKELRKTYKRIVPGSIAWGTGTHEGKITVVIRCATRGCKNTRRVATSDLFQVKYCEDCTREMRNAKRRKPTAPKAKRVAKAKKVEAVATA